MTDRKFPSKIFIDGGDPVETAKAEQLLGKIDGQTTNPSLVAKNPFVEKRVESGEKFSLEEINSFYLKIVEEISSIVEWSVSIETYADKNSTSKELITQAREMNRWSPKAWIKLPTTATGLEAASMLVKEGIRVNMTLCFSQQQAAAVYTATMGSKEPVFVSPFVGRLDDKGLKGMDLIKNILKMFDDGDGHVMTLTASIRHLDHLFHAFNLNSPIVTIPFSVFEKWAHRKFMMLSMSAISEYTNLEPIPFQNISLDKPWYQYDIYHELTETGLEKFAKDWNKLLK